MLEKIKITENVRLVLTVILFLFGLSACSKDEALTEYIPTEIPDEGTDNTTAMKETMIIRIADTSLTATLEDNATTKALVGMMPITLQMNELNGNEKYCYLQSSLPTSASNPGTIHAGDIMLYGSSCLVLFYKTFSTSYSYTKIGHVDNVSNLADMVGNGNISVTFETGSSTGVRETKGATNDNGDSPKYNLNGIREDKNYKGIYIKNGKKYK